MRGYENKNVKNVKKVLLVSLVSGLLAACGSDGRATSSMRIFHASADAPLVNILLDGKEALTAVDYQQSSGKLTLSAGADRI